MITKKELEKYVDLNDEVESTADFILQWYNENIEEVMDAYYLYFDKVEDSEIEYRGRDRCGDLCYFGLDASFLTKTEKELTAYIKEYKLQKEKELKQKEELAKQKVEKQKLNKEKSDYKKYLKLKEQFGG